MRKSLSLVWFRPIVHDRRFVCTRFRSSDLNPGTDSLCAGRERLRAEWDVAKHLRSGRLKQVMDNYETPPADIYAVYPHRHQFAGRVRAFVEFAAAAFARSAAGAASAFSRP